MILKMSFKWTERKALGEHRPQPSREDESKQALGFDLLRLKTLKAMMHSCYDAIKDYIVQLL